MTELPDRDPEHALCGMAGFARPEEKNPGMSNAKRIDEHNPGAGGSMHSRYSCGADGG
jgi:hypothetical protein